MPSSVLYLLPSLENHYYASLEKASLIQTQREETA